MGPELIEQPNDWMIENVALGSMMLEHDALVYGVAKLQPVHFKNNWNRCVFVALQRLNARMQHDKSITVITEIEVAQELKKMGRWRQTSEAFTYCYNCCEYATAPSNYRHYIDEVFRLSQLRSFYATGEFMALGDEIRESALQPDADPKHIASAIANALNAITRDGYADVKAIFQRTK
jgi:replicative DNA helicase